MDAKDPLGLVNGLTSISSVAKASGRGMLKRGVKARGIYDPITKQQMTNIAALVDRDVMKDREPLAHGLKSHELWAPWSSIAEHFHVLPHELVFREEFTSPIKYHSPYAMGGLHVPGSVTTKVFSTLRGLPRSKGITFVGIANLPPDGPGYKLGDGAISVQVSGMITIVNNGPENFAPGDFVAWDAEAWMTGSDGNERSLCDESDSGIPVAKLRPAVVPARRSCAAVWRELVWDNIQKEVEKKWGIPSSQHAPAQEYFDLIQNNLVTPYVESGKGFAGLTKMATIIQALLFVFQHGLLDAETSPHKSNVLKPWREDIAKRNNPYLGQFAGSLIRDSARAPTLTPRIIKPDDQTAFDTFVAFGPDSRKAVDALYRAQSQVDHAIDDFIKGHTIGICYNFARPGENIEMFLGNRSG